MDQERFIRLLESVLAPDTERVKLATTELRRDYYTLPDSLILLIQILTSHESAQLRQLAATQARSLAPKLWLSVPETFKPQIRNALLQSTLNEQTPLVRHSAARVISTIAKIDVEDGQWADLPSLIQHASSSSNVQHREVSTYILFTILESMADGFMHRFQELFSLFSKTIQDPESTDVRINTMLALSKMGMIVDAENDEASLQAFEEALPHMVAVLKQAVDAGDEDRVLQGFEVFQTLLTCDSKLLNKHFRDLVLFMVNIATDTAIDDDARVQALTFLIQTVTYRKFKFQSLKIGEQLTLGIIDIVTDNGEDMDDEDDQLTVSGSALGLLNCLASNLPPSHTVIHLLRVFEAGANSPDPNRRQAVIRALGTCVEGAPDFLNTQLKSYLPSMMRLLDDSNLYVREVALSGVRTLADQLAEDMAKEHERLIPALARNLDRAMQGLNGRDAKVNLGIVTSSCSAIDSLVTGLEPEQIKPYLTELVPHISHLLSHPDMKIKSSAIGAIGSIALSAKSDFLPFYEQAMNDLSEYVQLKESVDELDVRGVTYDAMGNIAIAIGAEAFQRYVIPMMQATEESLKLGHPRLKESSFLFWGDMVKVYEDNFKTFIPGVTNALFECLEQEESSVEVELGEEAVDLLGQEVVIAGRKVKVAGASDENGIDDNGMKSEDENDDSDNEWDDVTGATAIAMEKEIAIEVLANIVSFTKGEFLPYLEKSVELLMSMLDNAYEGVRRAAISALFRTYASSWNLQEEKMKTWQAGLPVKVSPNQDVVKLGEVVITATLSLWPTEDDRQTVIDINQNLAETLKLCGPSLVSGNGTVEIFTKVIVSLITKTHPCQQDFGEGEDEVSELNESSENDWLVMDTSFDVMMGLAKALGVQFGELWKIFEKSVLQYASSSEHSERCAAVGTIAECIAGMGDGVTPYTTILLKTLLHRLSDEDAETKANSAFAMGMLVENSRKEQELKNSFNSILTKLEPLLHIESSRARDNAVGCVSRMILKYREQVPLSEVLPALVDVLPLQEDYDENDPVYRMIVKLYSLRDQNITGLTQRLIPIIAQVMGPPDDQLTDEVREQLRELVGFIHSKQPALIQAHPVLMAAIQP